MMPDTQDAGKALVDWLRQIDNFDTPVSLNQAQVEVLLAYITTLEERNRTLEEIRDFHKGELAVRNGPVE